MQEKEKQGKKKRKKKEKATKKIYKSYNIIKNCVVSMIYQKSQQKLHKQMEMHQQEQHYQQDCIINKSCFIIKNYSISIISVRKTKKPQESFET